jgi:hypothetical protein
MANRKSAVQGQFSLSTPSMKENWDIQKARLKKKYPILTDTDLRYDEGKKGVMWEKLQIKLGLSKEAMRKISSPS